MSETRLETPEQMVDRLWIGVGHDNVLSRAAGAYAIRADREAIAALCEQMASEAWQKANEARERAKTGIANADPDPSVAVASMDATIRHEGQASAFRAVAAMLRGAR